MEYYRCGRFPTYLKEEDTNLNHTCGQKKLSSFQILNYLWVVPRTNQLYFLYYIQFIPYSLNIYTHSFRRLSLEVPLELWEKKYTSCVFTVLMDQSVSFD